MPHLERRNLQAAAPLLHAIEAVFPKAVVQPCIVHTIRNSLRYVGWKDWSATLKQFAIRFEGRLPE